MSFTCCPHSSWNQQRVSIEKRLQRTIARSVSVSGVGLFTGKPVEMTLLPHKAGAGVMFRRVDLPERPLVPATVEFVRATPRCTILGHGNVQVQTVEHLLAALRSYGIDNVLIELSAEEVPIFDGSSSCFIKMLEEAGVVEMEEEQDILRLKEPVFFSEGRASLIAIPAEEYCLSYTLDYPHCPSIGSQFYSIELSKERFAREIAPCRTFSIYEEIAPMIDKGLIKGGSLDSAVLIKEGRVANPEGLRFENEMVRHKLLDLIGDLSLLPPFVAHVIAICSGHTSNHGFAKQFLKHVKVESL
ncbi:MAG: UDP-3-O-[3-hydroxymyristoyl] N-acetylglucosamine deacetylase [Chlamydiota bacterium]